MSYQTEREDFIVRMAKHGMTADTARLILRHANAYQRLAVSECNGDDWQAGALVRCPNSTGKHALRTGYCGLCGVQDISLAMGAVDAVYGGHSKVSRSSVRMAQIEARLTVLCERATEDLRVDCSGDPRGYTVRILIMDMRDSVGVPTRAR